LIPGIGDISKANLGIERDLANEIMEVADINYFSMRGS
jgi:hypothetical protein